MAKKILIIDDDYNGYKAIKEILKKLREKVKKPKKAREIFDKIIFQ